MKLKIFFFQPFYFLVCCLSMALISCATVKTPPSVEVEEKKMQLPALSKPKPSSYKTRKVGLLLPLTGENAPLGQSLLNASEMAIFDAGQPALKIFPYDTKGTLEGAQVALQALLNEGVELIIGPIFAKEVESIKPLLQSTNIPLLSFSTDETLINSKTFILGFLPSQQIEAILNVARENNYTSIATLLPQDDYGLLIKRKLESLKFNYNIQDLYIYFYNKTDSLQKSLLDIFTQLNEKKFDALFIPESGHSLKLISEMIPLLHHKPIKIFGSGQWDSLDIVNFSSLNGAFFPSPNPTVRNDFEYKYQQLYKTLPPRISTLAYDAVSVTAALINQEYTFQNLTISQGFKGLDGLFRFKINGQTERSLSILEVTPSGFQVIKPAKRSFY